jgi:DNA-directed RNA polymerase specialized sigma24 family protein
MEKNKNEMDNDMTYEDIGNVIGAELNTVFMIKRRALDKAKNLLQKRGYKREDFFGEEK